MIDRLRRWWGQRGRIPIGLRAELEAEGLLLLEERLPVSIIFRGYEVPGQRARSGHQSGLASIALTEHRLVIRGTAGTQLDVLRGADWLVLALEAPDRLELAYDASAAHPNRSGQIEMELETPRAEAIHATLTQWMPRPST